MHGDLEKFAFLLFGSYIQLSFLYIHSEMIKEVLALDNHIKSIADELYQQRSLLVMGRGYNYATCLEGALVSTHIFMSMNDMSLMR